MNLKVLLAILIYYGVISLVFIFGASELTGFSSNIYLNDSSLSNPEIDTGGLFNSGVSFGRFFIFVLFGLGLPETTPFWFSTIFFLWQTLVTVLSVGFIIDSIWSG